MAGEYQHARTLCELRNERQAIFTREVNVKHHYVGAQPDCDFLCFCTVGSSDDIAQCQRCTRNEPPQSFAHCHLVIHHEYPDR